MAEQRRGSPNRNESKMRNHETLHLNRTLQSGSSENVGETTEVKFMKYWNRRAREGSKNSPLTITGLPMCRTLCSRLVGQ